MLTYVGMQGEDVIRSITPEHPGVVMVSCAFISTNVHWSKLSINLHNQSSYHHSFSFSYNLSSYDQSAKFVCHTERLHSIIYVHPKGELLLLQRILFIQTLHNRL